MLTTSGGRFVTGLTYAASMSRPRDTAVEVLERQLDGWRMRTPLERAQLADRMSVDVTALAIAGIRFERPDATADEVRHELARRRYGRALADAAFSIPPPR